MSKGNNPNKGRRYSQSLKQKCRILWESGKYATNSEIAEEAGCPEAAKAISRWRIDERWGDRKGDGDGNGAADLDTKAELSDSPQSDLLGLIADSKRRIRERLDDPRALKPSEIAGIVSSIEKVDYLEQKHQEVQDVSKEVEAWVRRFARAFGEIWDSTVTDLHEEGKVSEDAYRTFVALHEMHVCHSLEEANDPEYHDAMRRDRRERRAWGRRCRWIDNEFHRRMEEAPKQGDNPYSDKLMAQIESEADQMDWTEVSKGSTVDMSVDNDGLP